jgi:cytochrome c
MRLRVIPTIGLTAGAVLLAALAALGGDKDDAVAGRTAFEKRCTGCHALDHEKTGPRLAGVVGRRAGAIPAFPYSDAVKNAGLVWNETNLDKWLTDPESLIPDNDMTFRLDNRAERAAIIAFLKSTSN